MGKSGLYCADFVFFGFLPVSPGYLLFAKGLICLL
jgi:hypothetical protein